MKIVLCCLMMALATGDDQWPGFLGPPSDDLNVETLPLEWTPDENVAWKLELDGYGQSSPVIFGEQVFVCSVDGPNKEDLVVSCFDLKTGEESWEKRLASTNPEKSSVYVSRAAPTPVVDAKGVYVYFESGDVFGLSHSGEQLWSRSLSKDYGKPTNEFGLSASPVQDEKRLYILIDDPEKSYLVSLNKESGVTEWKSDREPRTSWTSPSLMTLDGKVQIICSSAGSVDGYDPESGEQLWTYTDVGGNTGTTPTQATSNGMLTGASTGRSGENSEMARKTNGLLKVSHQQGSWEVSYEWTNPALSTAWASPIAHRGYGYWVNRTGVLYCVDLVTGEQQYAERLDQTAWATPVGIGERIYVFGKEGVTSVVQAGAEFKLLAENKLWTDEKPPVNHVPEVEEADEQRRQSQAMFSKPTIYGVAIADSSIVIRTGSQLFCIRKP